MAIQFVTINFFNPELKIGLEDVRNAWLLEENNPVKLNAQVHRGALVYRLPGSGKRVSFHKLKNGLIKRKLKIKIAVSILPF
jgi:hypothetical protein